MAPPAEAAEGTQPGPFVHTLTHTQRKNDPANGEKHQGLCWNPCDEKWWPGGLSHTELGNSRLGQLFKASVSLTVK